MWSKLLVLFTVPQMRTAVLDRITALFPKKLQPHVEPLAMTAINQITPAEQEAAARVAHCPDQAPESVYTGWREDGITYEKPSFLTIVWLTIAHMHIALNVSILIVISVWAWACWATKNFIHFTFDDVSFLAILVGSKAIQTKLDGGKSPSVKRQEDGRVTMNVPETASKPRSKYSTPPKEE